MELDVRESEVSVQAGVVFAVIQNIEDRSMNLERERRIAAEVFGELDKLGPKKRPRKNAVLIASAGSASPFALSVARHFVVDPIHCDCLLDGKDAQECWECIEEYAAFDFVVIVVDTMDTERAIGALIAERTRKARRVLHRSGLPDICVVV